MLVIMEIQKRFYTFPDGYKSKRGKDSAGIERFCKNQKNPEFRKFHQVDGLKKQVRSG